MLKNNMKITFRHLSRHKVYSMINILSLSISFSVLIFIALFVKNELDHDKHNVNLKRIYTILMDRQQSLISAAGPELAENIPEILKYTRFIRRNNYALQYHPGNGKPDQSIMIKDLSFVWTDPDMFEIFTYEFAYGDPETALNEPYTIVLTEDVAQRLFGSENPIGKIITLNNKHDVTVTAVVKKPEQSHLKYSVFGSVLTLRVILGPEADRNYEDNTTYTYVLLPENCDLEAVNRKINNHMKKVFERVDRESRSFSLLPAKDLYFSNIRFTGNHGNMTMMWILITVALFIIIIAAINFINLSTARASTRAREVGIKRVVGVMRKDLIRQFLGESIFMALLAFALSLVLVLAFLPILNSSLSINLSRMSLFQPLFMGLILSIVCFIGLLSGIYPAFYLSSFLPLKVIKGEITRGRQGILFRKSMIIFQFTVSIILITSTLTIFKQIHFMNHKDLGFSGHNVMTFAIPRSEAFSQHVKFVKTELLKHPDILRVSISHGYPGRPSNNESLKIHDEFIGFTHYSADSEFINIYKLNLLQGRFLDTDRQADHLRSVVLNETAVREFGLTNPVGQQLPHEVRGLTAFPVDELIVLGVVKDFHCRPLHREINPVIISYNEEWLSRFNILLSGKNLSDVVAHIETIWKQFAPGIPFEYIFVDEDFKSMYEKDVTFQTIFFYASGFSIFITCLGLLGLVSFITEKRTKEIGIRKVLGASLSRIFFLISHEFSTAILMANILAWPIAYFAMNKWLQSFAYRIDIGLWIFAVSSLLALFMALLTVSYQSIKAATANPVDSLRYE